ncbi:MAG: CocE/NonD family hydrolase [bacterium]|nr:CocE/NonD family hydrolase [bacterium]
MIKKTKIGLLAALACLVLGISGEYAAAESSGEGVLPQSEAQKIEEALEKAGAAGVQVELNVRITVPKEKNPYSDEDQDLWATVIRPLSSFEKKGETILTCTIYNRVTSMINFIPLVLYGYTYVVVDNRGTGSSAGEWCIADLVEQYDTKYIIDDWVPEQEWSNGKVGMIGYSYMGINELLVSGLVDVNESGEPDHLKAIFPLSPCSDIYKDLMSHGGNVGLSLPLYLLVAVDALSLMPSMLYSGEENLSPTYEDIGEAVATTLEHLANVPTYVDWISDYERRFDSEWYDRRSPMSYWPEKPAGGWGFPEGDRVFPSKLPVFMNAGWFDICLRGALNQYEYGFKNHSDSNKALIIGEWYHSGASLGIGMPAIELMSLPARWFEWKLRGNEDAFMTDFPVVMQVMGDGRWRAEKSWPLPESRVESKRYYLSKQEAEPIEDDWFTGRSSNQLYSLVETLNEYDLSPENPVMDHTVSPLGIHGLTSRTDVIWMLGIPTLPGQISKLHLGVDLDKYLPYEDERLDDWKIPTFTTEALEEDVEIVGPLTLTFWARTEFTQPLTQQGVDSMTEFIKDILGIDTNLFLDMMNEQDVQWVAALDDVQPEGRARNITSGWLRASHRPYDPNEPETLTEHAVDPSYTAFDPFYNRPDKEPKLIKEGDLYQYRVELWPTCNVFKKGHRIRLTLTGSDFPHLLPVMRPSSNTIVIDSEHQAVLDFKTANKEGEGTTWKWVDEVNSYLVNHTDSSAGSSGSEDSANSGDSSAESSSGFSCGSSANAAGPYASAASIISGLLSTLATMFFPLMLILFRRFKTGKR